MLSPAAPTLTTGMPNLCISFGFISIVVLPNMIRIYTITFNFGHKIKIFQRFKPVYSHRYCLSFTRIQNKGIRLNITVLKFPGIFHLIFPPDVGDLCRPAFAILRRPCFNDDTFVLIALSNSRRPFFVPFGGGPQSAQRSRKAVSNATRQVPLLSHNRSKFPIRM